MSDTQTKQWFNDLTTKITVLAEQFDLDPIQTETFRETMLNLCKQEYMAGNKSGIKWAFKKASEKQSSAQAAGV